jgi:hypothetical protein
MMLAIAEECLCFEHRDLHWGNVLLRPLPHAQPLPFTYRDRTIYVANAGVQACLIDFTLSRASFPAAGTRHADLEQDDWLFGPDQTGPQVRCPHGDLARPCFLSRPLCPLFLVCMVGVLAVILF